jgi:hypothetical protein
VCLVYVDTNTRKKVMSVFELEIEIRVCVCREPNSRHSFGPQNKKKQNQIINYNRWADLGFVGLPDPVEYANPASNIAYTA